MRAFFVALLLFALPLSADSTLVEYGEGSRSEGLLWLDSPPFVKIWRNGRIVFVRDGVWTAVLPPDRIARLEKDLARSELLQQGTRYVDIEPVGPIGLHGGMSYVRFRSGEDEVIIGTAGRPYRRGPWLRLIERIRAEIPDEAVQWIPAEVTFANWTWTSRRDGRNVTPWPFGDRLRLTGSEQRTTDPVIIAFLLSHSFRDESWRRIIEADGVLWYVYVTNVPDWLDRVSMTGMVLDALYAQRFPR